jgi:hypothetical protein
MVPQDGHWTVRGAPIADESVVKASANYSGSAGQTKLPELGAAFELTGSSRWPYEQVV